MKRRGSLRSRRSYTDSNICVFIGRLSYIIAIKRKVHRDGKEIDFLIVQDNQPTHLIEIKNKDDKPSNAFSFYKKYFETAKLL